MPIPPDIQSLIDQFIQNTISEEDSSRLDDWLLESDENMFAFEKELERQKPLQQG